MIVTFHLGTAVGLSSRRFRIYAGPLKAGQTVTLPPTAINDQTLSGSTETVTVVDLPNGARYTATLVDTRSSGEVSKTDTLSFNTLSLQFPGPRSEDRLRILSMEDDSSSSSSSSSSSTSTNIQPLAPTFTVNGVQFSHIFPQGTQVTGQSASWWRGPVVKVLSSGNVLVMAAAQATSQDGTGAYCALCKSTDSGQNFSDPVAIPVASIAADATHQAALGGSSISHGPFALHQLANGHVRCYINSHVNGQSAIGNPYFYSYMDDNGDEGATWQARVDISSSTLFKGSQIAITSITDPSAPTPRIALATSSALNQSDDNNGWQAGYGFMITGLVGSGSGAGSANAWAAAVNGKVFYLTNRVDVSTFESTQLPNFPSTGTFDYTNAKIQTVGGWVAPITQHCALLPDGSHVLCLYYRKHYQGAGNFGAWISSLRCEADNVTFTPSTIDENSTSAVTGSGTDGTIEPRCVSTGGNNLYYSVNCKAKSTTGKFYHGSAFSTDRGNTITGFRLDDGTGGTTHIANGSDPCAVIAVGGGYLLLSNDCDDTATGTLLRQRMTGWYTTDPTFKTFNNKLPLFSGQAWYNDADIFPNGTMIAVLETGEIDTQTNYEGGGSNTAGDAIGSIGIVRFNLLGLQNGVERIVYTFNEQPAGEEAWTGAASIIDHGTCNHKAMPVGRPQYVAYGAGRNGTAIKIGPGGSSDGIQIAFTKQTMWDPDRLASDTGDFVIDVHVKTEHSGDTGVFDGSNSAIGQGKANNVHGLTIEIDSGGKLRLTLCDGSTASPVSSPQIVNDAAWHAVRFIRKTSLRGSAGSLNALNTEVNPVVSTTVGTDATTGDICDRTYANSRFLGKYDGVNCPWTTTGHGLEIALFAMAKNVNVEPQYAFPYEPPVAETFPAQAANDPTTMGTPPDLWVFPNMGGYAMREMNHRASTKLHLGAGRSALAFVSNGSKRFYSSTLYTPQMSLQRLIDGTVGGKWSVGLNGQAAGGQLDPRTIGAFNYVGCFTHAWTVGGLINIPSGDPGTLLLNNLDLTSLIGFCFYLDYSNQQRIVLDCGSNSPTPNDFVFCTALPGSSQFNYNQYYYWAMSFSGSGGANLAGLMCYLIPYTSLPLTLGIVTANKGAPSNVEGDTFKSTTAKVGTCPNPLQVGGYFVGQTPRTSAFKASDLCIWPFQLTDQQILNQATWAMGA